MKVLLGCIVALLCLAVVAQQESISCIDQNCAPVDESACECGLNDDPCCPVCCTECVQCFVDPCQDWACQGYPGYVCQSNYCGGCNRDWFTSAGEPVECEVELHGEHPCAAVDCMPIGMQDCSGTCGTTTGDTCCEHCCDLGCADCFVNPCDGYYCQDSLDFTCEANYCGGCNRDWLNQNGDRVTCHQEVHGQNPGGDNWNTDCIRDSDCGLKNFDFGFDCCWYGSCSTSDFSEDNYKPVNVDWWQSKHDANCQMTECDLIECILIYIKPEFEAVCKHRQCAKIAIPSVSDNNSNSNQDKSSTESDRTSGASMLAATSAIVAVVLAL